jgi:hypothetical protein
MAKANENIGSLDTTGTGPLTGIANLRLLSFLIIIVTLAIEAKDTGSLGTTGIRPLTGIANLRRSRWLVHSALEGSPSGRSGIGNTTRVDQPLTKHNKIHTGTNQATQDDKSLTQHGRLIAGLVQASTKYRGSRNEEWRRSAPVEFSRNKMATGIGRGRWNKQPRSERSEPAVDSATARTVQTVSPSSTPAQTTTRSGWSSIVAIGDTDTLDEVPSATDPTGAGGNSDFRG